MSAQFAHLADDQALLTLLTDSYIGAYFGGAASALLRSAGISEHAAFTAAHALAHAMNADPAVRLTIEQGYAELLRTGTPPAPTSMTTARADR